MAVTYKNGSDSITNGSGTAVCRAQLGWEKTSESSTSVSYKLSVYVYCIRYGYSTSGALSASLSCSGHTSKSVSGQSCNLDSGERKQLISSTTYTFTKKTSSYSPTIKFSVKSTGSSVSGTSSGTLTPTIPALTSHKVSYNNNGGTGSISAQTKYYGQSITLSKGTAFTRTNYSLTGWNTASDGSGTHYNLGAKYSVNSTTNRTLYAEWHLDYISPKIKDLVCYRVETATSTEEKDDGQYIRVMFNYTGGSTNGGSSYITPLCTITIDGVTVRADSVLDSSTGSFAAVYGGSYSKDSTHTVIVTLHDTTGNISIKANAIVSTATYALDLIGDGDDVYMGVMHPAVSGKPLVTAPLYVDGDISAAGKFQNFYKITRVTVNLPNGCDAGTYIASANRPMTAQAGYTAVGIVGCSSTNFRVQPTTRYVVNDSTIFAGFANLSSTNVTSSVDVVFYVLWLKATAAS